MKKIRNSKKQQRGQSLVEMAVSVTFMLLLLGGVVDLGRAFFAFMSMRDAAQEGAIYGSINPTDSAGIATRIRTSSNYPVDLSNTSDVIISSRVIGNACAGNAIEVTVTHEFEVTMPFLGSVIGRQSFPLKATVTDTILQPACP